MPAECPVGSSPLAILLGQKAPKNGKNFFLQILETGPDWIFILSILENGQWCSGNRRAMAAPLFLCHDPEPQTSIKIPTRS